MSGVRSMARARLLCCLLFALPVASFSQGKYISGEFKGFTINEPVINKLEKDFTVAKIKGQVVFRDDDGAPMKDVLFELQGPGETQKIRSAITNEDGIFEIRNVAEGVFKFKASAVGYDAIAGKVIVSKSAKHPDHIRICLQPGF